MQFVEIGDLAQDFLAPFARAVRREGETGIGFLGEDYGFGESDFYLQ